MTLRDRIRSGSGSTAMPVGSMVFEFFVPGISRMARASGADFLIFDTEHSGTGIESIKAQCAACDGVGIAPVVRVPEHGYHFVAGALDAGAHGVMVPMVGTAEQAREIVSFSHYPPAGRRGAAFGIAHDGYTPGTPQQKIAEADARTLVIAMIETPEGVANVDEIAAVPGVDVVWLGHFDLTIFMGIPGQFSHPDYLAAVAGIARSAREHGKVAGVMATDEAWARDYYGHGFRLFAYGLDAHLYQRALKTGIEAIRRL